jgi:redox-sensitive bicupin YhaK (pirin superfamily)
MAAGRRAAPLQRAADSLGEIMELERVIAARHGNLGHGLEVQRILPFAKRRMVGPFIFLDHAGPLQLAAATMREADIRPHPHIGLSTVSYLFSGRVTHRDSLGVEQIIKPGEVNWMTAGRGISHSERFDSLALCPDEPLELLQSWVALPAENEEDAPAFDNYPTAALPLTETPQMRVRLIAGEAYGLHSPVATHSPLFYAHVELAAGAVLPLPRGYAERAAYIAHGRLRHDGIDYQAGQMLVFTPGGEPVVTALEACSLMLLGGEPLGERHIWWNFVSSRKDRIEAAKADWLAGRIALPPMDDQEFIPLPQTPAQSAKPEPLS